MLLEKEREQIVAYGIKCSREGLCPGTSGNISIYDPEQKLMAISPSGISYEETTPEDIVVTDLEANIVEGGRKPSSEWALHTTFYKNRSDIRAIVHTHSEYCTTFAVLGRPIKAVHYAMSDAGVPEIPCIPFILFGTEELAQAAYEGCGKGKAVLLGNHGILCLGDTIDKAYSLALNLEYTAKLQFRAETIGKPHFLTDAQMEEVIRRFGNYGQADGKKAGY